MRGAVVLLPLIPLILTAHAGGTRMITGSLAVAYYPDTFAYGPRVGPDLYRFRYAHFTGNLYVRVAGSPGQPRSRDAWASGVADSSTGDPGLWHYEGWSGSASDGRWEDLVSRSRVVGGDGGWHNYTAWAWSHYVVGGGGGYAYLATGSVVSFYNMLVARVVEANGSDTGVRVVLRRTGLEGVAVDEYWVFPSDGLRDLASFPANSGELVLRAEPRPSRYLVTFVEGSHRWNVTFTGAEVRLVQARDYIVTIFYDKAPQPPPPSNRPIVLRLVEMYGEGAVRDEVNVSVDGGPWETRRLNYTVSWNPPDPRYGGVGGGRADVVIPDAAWLSPTGPLRLVKVRVVGTSVLYEGPPPQRLGLQWYKACPTCGVRWSMEGGGSGYSRVLTVEFYYEKGGLIVKAVGNGVGEVSAVVSYATAGGSGEATTPFSLAPQPGTEVRLVASRVAEARGGGETVLGEGSSAANLVLSTRDGHLCVEAPGPLGVVYAQLPPGAVVGEVRWPGFWGQPWGGRVFLQVLANGTVAWEGEVGYGARVFRPGVKGDFARLLVRGTGGFCTAGGLLASFSWSRVQTMFFTHWEVSGLRQGNRSLSFVMPEGVVTAVAHYSTGGRTVVRSV